MCVLYHFPSEPIVLKDLRRSALEELRWRLRVPVVRQFGSAAVEAFALVVRCSDCKHVSAALTGLSSGVFETSWGQMLDHFCADETWQATGAIPSKCPACGSSKVQPVSAFLAKFLPSVGKDFQAEFIFRAGKVNRTHLYLMAPDGDVESVSRADILNDRLPPLSVRAAWRQLIGGHLFHDDVACLAIEKGYEIGLRPYADSSWDIHGLNTKVEAILAEREQDGYDVFVLLRDSVENDMGLLYSDVYVSWLGGYANDISSAAIEPFVLLDSTYFCQVFVREAERLGLSAQRIGGSDSLRMCFSSEHMHVEVDVAHVLLKTVHAGLNFSEGILTFFGRELSGIRAGVEAFHLVREALPMLSVTIENGTCLTLKNDGGDKVSSIDAIAFATEYDLRRREEFEQGLKVLAPNHPPLPLTLGPHVAGQVSPVVRRV